MENRDWSILNLYSESASAKTKEIGPRRLEEVVHKTAWFPKEQLQELTRRLGLLGETINQNASVKPQPNDVIAAVPPKSGTSWLLHICHQLRMHGAEPDFDNQTDVVTWIELAEKRYGIDPATMSQPAKPYILATHLPYPLVPKRGKLIYCYREQKDVLMSAYHYLDSLLALKGRVNVNTFAQVWYHQVEKNLEDLLMWWEHRHDENVLFLFYDDLLEDHTGSVRLIAKFINIDCDEDAFARVVHTTTHAEMARNSSKFESCSFAVEIAKMIGESQAASGSDYVGRVRKTGGRSGDGQQLTSEVQVHIDQQWHDIVTSKLGFQNLNEMRQDWHKEQC